MPINDRTRRRFLASDVQLVVERSSEYPIEYAIVLLVLRDGRWRTVRTFDNAHDPGEHHEHAYVGLEKQSPTVTHGPVNDAMHVAELKLLREWRRYRSRPGSSAMSEITDKTDELFMAASRSDDDLGYPADVAFVPSDEDWTDDVLWRNLIEGQATVLVSEDTELLLIPLRRGVIDRLRGRVPVSVAPRTHGHASSYATLSRLGRHPVCQMRALAHA